MASTHSTPTTGAEGARATGAVGRALRGVVRVLPACAASALFAHLAWYGLRPALAERERLDAVERDVRTRHERLLATEARLRTTEDALSDEIYRERLRRNFAHEREAERAAARAAAPSAELRDPTWFGRPGEAESLTRGAQAPPAADGGGTRGEGHPRRSRVR